MPKEILLTHARQYPMMKPCDAVKLLYQSEFGGGHMIRDEQACLDFLQQEYAATAQTDAPLLEEIGNGFVRVMLASLDIHHYPPAQLGRDFIRSAAVAQGNIAAFLEKLSVLTELTAKGQMPFSMQELENYLTNYAAAGYPAVSHSEIYRNAYHPAYRVMQICHLPQSLQKQV